MTAKPIFAVGIPRSAGLMEIDRIQERLSEQLTDEKPFVGTFCQGDNIYFKNKDGYWLLSDYGSETMRHAATDGILFYADPNDIV